MRNITKIMCDSFKSDNPADARVRKMDNTAVTHDGETVAMVLHGHTIALRSVRSPELLTISMCGWATPTTRERLNGLLPDGLRIVQHSGDQLFQKRIASDWTGEVATIDPQGVYIINTATKTVEKFNG